MEIISTSMEEVGKERGLKTVMEPSQNEIVRKLEEIELDRLIHHNK